MTRPLLINSNLKHAVLGSGRAQSAAHGAARVALVDCVAFAASFLPWSDFVEFAEDCAAQCVAEGGIEGAFVVVFCVFSPRVRRVVLQL